MFSTHSARFENWKKVGSHGKFRVRDWIEDRERKEPKQ